MNVKVRDFESAAFEVSAAFWGGSVFRGGGHKSTFSRFKKGICFDIRL